jgi:AcrR family transcriptional regulator
MMAHALFEHADFLGAARALVAEHGPAAVTVNAVTERLNAPKGSFYYRFASRDLLLGELWLAATLSYQDGFVRAIEAGDGLAAALHVPVWARVNLDDARLLLLYGRRDFIAGEWPAALKQGVADQARRFEGCVARFAKDAFGAAGPKQLRIAQFVLAEVPIAAVRPHLRRREPPPPLVDALIRATFEAIVSGDGALKAVTGARRKKR